MNWTLWIRQSHRWLSIIFALTVIVNFAVRAGPGEPPPWLTYSPLPPLVLQLLTGLCLFTLPYVTKWDSGPGSGQQHATDGTARRR
jgi:hypothetical protein